MGDFNWRHVQGEVNLWAVRWYCRYPISMASFSKRFCRGAATRGQPGACWWREWSAIALFPNGSSPISCAPTAQQRRTWPQSRPLVAQGSQKSSRKQSLAVSKARTNNARLSVAGNAATVRFHALGYSQLLVSAIPPPCCTNNSLPSSRSVRRMENRGLHRLKIRETPALLSLPNLTWQRRCGQCNIQRIRHIVDSHTWRQRSPLSSMVISRAASMRCFHGTMLTRCDRKTAYWKAHERLKRFAIPHERKTFQYIQHIIWDVRAIQHPVLILKRNQVRLMVRITAAAKHTISMQRARGERQL